jgi:hypothetical protein
MSGILNKGLRLIDVEQAFAADYLSSQYAVVQYLSEHLADCSREFGGDLQQVLIIAVVGQVSLEALTRGVTPDKLPGISASRLADVCGIPRETVRRKLKLLEAKAWVRQIDEQHWTIVFNGRESEARKDLADLERRSIGRLARMIAAFERLSARSQPVELDGLAV